MIKFVLYFVAAIFLLVFIIGLSGEDTRNSSQPPHVSWSKYAAYKKIGIEKSISEKSCSGLQKAFDAAEGSELLNFIDWHLNKLGCYN
jgi:hypothetical protein